MPSVVLGAGEDTFQMRGTGSAAKTAVYLLDGGTLVIDGYHAFCAVEVDLSAIHARAFYLGGGYKYAQAGEGFGYLHVPAGCRHRGRCGG